MQLEKAEHTNMRLKDLFTIGKPARKAYSLFPIIDEMGKGFEYIEALLIASFQDEINIGNDAYLENLVSSLRLDWSDVKNTSTTSNGKKI